MMCYYSSAYIYQSVLLTKFRFKDESQVLVITSKYTRVQKQQHKQVNKEINSINKTCPLEYEHYKVFRMNQRAKL